MKTYQNQEHQRLHLVIRQPATEPQAVISWGEEFLDRARNLAHAIEEHVHQALNAQTNTTSRNPLNLCDPLRN